MSNYNNLKSSINNNIYENQTQQITGTVLNAILNEMTNALGAGYQFAGVATVGMTPSEPDARIFYLAGEGIYTSFDGIQVPAGKLGILKWDNRWHLETIDGLGSGGANLTGYVTVASTDDLPDEGVATLGYLCGENLYLYVGEGGDTKEGKYQNCGSFRGPQGDSVQDVEQTQTSLENGGVNKIKFTLSNGISCEFQVRNGTTSSGLFPTLAALQAAYPSPVVGQYAFVGSGFPADIYVCTTAGTWSDSGEDYDGDNVDLTDYATKAEVNELDLKVDKFPYDYPNLFQNRTYAAQNITDAGKLVGNSNAATIRYKCEPNTLYKISNPSGGRLVVGSSSATVAANETFSHYEVSSDTTYIEFKTGASEIYLYICYWAAAASSVTAAGALDELSVNWITAKDQYSRDKIDAAYNGALAESRNIYDPHRHWYAGMNMQTAGQIVGTYTDRGVVFVPVHGLSKVTIAIKDSGNTATGCRYCWYDNARAAIGSAIGNIPVYGENNFSVLDVPEGAYFLGFLVYYAGCELDANGAPKCMVQSGDQYTGYVPYNGTTVSQDVARPKDVYVCAKNSEAKYRKGCDYCCDGVNDELTIQAALDSVGICGTLYLAPGIYYIGSFQQQSDGQYCAIQYKLDTGSAPERRVKIKCFDQTPIRQNGYSQLRRCATLRVTSTCYSGLDSDTQYSVLGVETSSGARVWNGNIFDCEGIAVEIPGNQKKVIAFDAYYAFCMMMFKCMATAIPTNAVPSTPGVDLCIGIRCTKGSNFGQESQINTCAMYGFGQGVAVMGEHYVLTNVKTIYNKYGFTFNWFGSTDGGYSHPNTLINCCSEMDMNYPYFGQNTQNQSLTFIDFNMEHRTAVFAMGGNRATELVPGSWRGTIHYTIKVYGTDGYSITGNSPYMPFWADGCGGNMLTINDAETLEISNAKAKNDTGLKGKTVVCFGDSFTELNGTDNHPYTYHLARVTGANIVNLGVQGARLYARTNVALTPTSGTQANAAFDIINVVRAACGVDFDGENTYNDVLANAATYLGVRTGMATTISNIDWSKVDSVIILGGTNDWTNTALENAKGAIGDIVQILLTAHPTVKLYWFTPTVRWDDYSGSGSSENGFSDTKQYNGKTLYEYSAGLEAAAKENHIPVCDLYNTLGWTKYNFSQYFPDNDGVHPRKAFNVLAYRIASFIASVKAAI